MKFIDLFSGLGGFHLALAGLGHDCVFASEIDPELSSIYRRNFGIDPVGDIRENVEKVPPHDILCAGFPCQPFSKAGVQMGFGCPSSGDLFDYVIKIARRVRPKFMILENVPNILRHNDGESWKIVSGRLKSAGYCVDAKLLSPHQFGVPQNRDRAIIIASRSGLADFRWPETTKQVASIYSVLDINPPDAKLISVRHLQYLKTWQRVIRRFPRNVELPSFPIWAMEFGANYPVDGQTPSKLSFQELKRFRGAFGAPLSSAESKREAMAMLPSYALTEARRFPYWKQQFILQNREFYRLNRSRFAEDLEIIKTYPSSFQKLEWNWKGGPKDLWKTVIQFRASGIRVKRPTTAPSLVAFTDSQIPIIAWERRFMTLRECARLQSIDALSALPEGDAAAFKALGNAVNVRVIGLVAEALCGFALMSPKRDRRLVG